MELVLPELIDLNTYINLERGNRYAAASKKKQFTETVAWEARRQIGKSLTINKITFIWKHKNKRKDMDNIEFQQKFVWDGLVQAGIIPNDNWGNRPARTLHKHEVDKNNPGVVVVIK